MGWRASVCVLVSLFVSGCVEATFIPCGDKICPTTSVCIAEVCVLGSAVAACDDMGEGDGCAFRGVGGITYAGMCIGGVCTPPSCNDGKIDPMEDCDGDDLAGQSCVDHGFYEPGGLACNANCRFDVSACVGACGDAVLNGSELCDGHEFLIDACTAFGYDYGAIGCTASCDLDLSTCGYIGFRREPVGIEYANAVWTSGDDGWLVGWGRVPPALNIATAIARYDAQQRVWKRVDAPVIASELRDVWSDGVHVFAVGAQGAVRFDGSDWSTSTPGDLRAVSGTSHDNVWAVGQNRIWRWQGGPEWSRSATADLGLGNLNLVDVQAVSTDDVWAVGSNGTLIRYHDAQWSVIAIDSGPPDATSLFVTDSPFRLFIGSSAGMYETDLTSTSVHAIGNVRSLGGTGQSDVYAATENDVWHWNGTDLVPLMFEPGGRISRVHVEGQGKVAVAAMVEQPGLDPRVGRLDGVARVKTRASFSVADHTLAALGGQTRGSLFGVGGGVAAVYALANATWSHQTLFVADPPQACDQFQSCAGGLRALTTVGNMTYAAGTNLPIYKREDSTWSEVHPVTSIDVRGVWASAAHDVLFAGIFDSGQGGTQSAAPHANLSCGGGTGSPALVRLVGTELQCVTPPTNLAGAPAAVWGSSATDTWIVTDRGAITYYDGTMWSIEIASTGVAAFYDVWGLAATDVWAVGRLGAAYHYDGTTWTSTSLGTVEDLVRIRGSRSDRIFAVTRSGEAVYYDGARWSPFRIGVTPGAGGLHALHVLPDTLVVGGHGILQAFVWLRP